jgi:hypothetical protein
MDDVDVGPEFDGAEGEYGEEGEVVFASCGCGLAANE